MGLLRSLELLVVDEPHMLTTFSKVLKSRLEIFIYLFIFELPLLPLLSERSTPVTLGRKSK